MAALMLGLIGTFQKNFIALPDDANILKIVLDSISQSFRVFFPRITFDIGQDNWFLTIARVFGTIFSFATILSVLWSLFRDEIDRLRASFASGHTIVIGYGETAVAFAEAINNETKDTICIIDTAPSYKNRDNARSSSFLYFACLETVTQKSALKVVNIRKANRIIVASHCIQFDTSYNNKFSSDEENLHSLRIIEELNLIRENKVEIIINIDDITLLERLEESTDITRMFGENVRLRFFNQARESAVNLSLRTPFIDQALARHQERVHLIIIGNSDVAIESVIHFIKISPTLGLIKPRIDFIVKDQNEFAQIAKTRGKAFGELVDFGIKKTKEKPSLNWAVEFGVHQIDSNAVTTDQTLLKKIASYSKRKVTAVIYADNNSETNLQHAINLQNHIRQGAYFKAPFYVWSQQSSAIDKVLRRLKSPEGRHTKFLKNINETDQYGAVIEPFGRISNICSKLTLSGIRQRLAQQSNAEYMKTRTKEKLSEAGDTWSAQNASLSDWNSLEETYKAANLRQVDHNIVKLISAGLQVLDIENWPKLTKEQLEHDNLLEKLAVLEHNSWWIDRELNGWRYGKVRDNNRKLHNNCLPYDKLDEQTKDYDRNAVRALME